MALSNTKLNILIVGASGWLGPYIVKHGLQRPELKINIMVRDPSKNQELTDLVEKAGGKVFKGDVTQPETLIESTKDIHTVISLVKSLGDKVVFEGQISLLNASIKNGVKRFVPSDFGPNYAHFTREELNQAGVLTPKLKFQDELDKAPISQLRFYQGFIAEFFFKIIGGIQSNGFDFGYWGDDDVRVDFTSFDDLAKAVVAGVSRPDLNGQVVFVGDSLSFREMAQVYNKVRGTNIQAKKNGSVGDLRKLYQEKRQASEFLAELYGLWLLISDKRIAFEKNNNSDLPEVKATPFEEVLKQRPDLEIHQKQHSNMKISS